MRGLLRILGTNADNTSYVRFAGVRRCALRRKYDSTMAPSRSELRADCPLCRGTIWDLAGWSAAEAGEITGIPARTVQHWRKTEVFEPSIEWPPGSKRRYYGLGDLVALTCLREALEAGADRPVAIQVASEIADGPIDWREAATLGWWHMRPHSTLRPA